MRVARLAFVYGEGDPHLAESLMWARRWPAHKRLHPIYPSVYTARDAGAL